MSTTGICSCESPTFGNMNRPSCVIEQKALAFPIFVPRYKADGSRFTFDLTSATLGADITAAINAADPQDRIYPMPRVENSSFDRTDTVFETAASTRKYKIDGVGGVRTFNMELWAKSAVHAMLRELKKFGCSDIDMLYVDIAGNLWGIKDSVNDSILRGYEVSSETFDAYKVYATETSVSKIMVSFDLDNNECEENSYAITNEELGYKANTLEGLITGYMNLTDGVDELMTVEVYSAYGSAGNRHDIEGLDSIPVTVTLVNGTTGVAAAATTVLTATANAGEYTFPYVSTEFDTSELIQVSISGATGFDIQDSEVAHAF